MRWRIGVVVAVVLLAASACVIPVEDLGGTWSAATGVNDAGVVAGTSSVSGSSEPHAFKRLPDRTVVDLGPMPGCTGLAVAGINGAGVVVGTAFCPSGQHAVSWDAAGHLTDLGAGAANDINDAGIIVGEGPDGAFVFDPTVGHRVLLPALPGTSASTARGINDAGQVVGWQDAGDFSPFPVRWDLTTGGVVDLSESLDQRWFFPVDINDAGTMVGFASFAADPDDSPSEAVIVPAGSTQVVALGAGAWSVAEALNESDTVVGFGGEANDQPFRWQPDTGPVLLDEGAGSASDVNESGTIVGSVNHRAAFLSFPSTP